MFTGQRLAISMVLAIAGMTGLCSNSRAGTFAITAYFPDGTTIAATKLTIEYKYTHATLGATDTTCNPSAYPINLTCDVHTLPPVNIGVTFTITYKDTGESVTITLHGNKPTTTPINIIFQPQTLQPMHAMSRHLSHPSPESIPSSSCVILQPTFCYTETVSYSIPCMVPHYAVSSCRPVPCRWYSSCP